VPVRDASAATAQRGSERLCLSHSPEYLNKEIGRFWEKMIYDRGTVQPGAAMTVKEMGPVNRSRSAAFFLSHSCLRRRACAEKSGPFEPPLSGLFGLRLAGIARPI